MRSKVVERLLFFRHAIDRVGVLILLLLCACSKIGGNVGGSHSSITGQLVDLAQIQSLRQTNRNAKVKANVSTLSCTSAVVKLYRLSNSGTKITPELATATVNADGSYELSLTGIDVNVSANSADPLLVEVSGCTDTRSRVVTGTAGQDLSLGSSLITWLQQTPYSSKLVDASRASLTSLLGQLESQGSYADAYALLTSDASSTNLFQQLFAAPPSVLMDAAPVILSSNVPSSAHEGSAINMSVSSKHWSPSYSQFYLWKIGSTVINSGIDVNSVAFTPTANMQGARTITLYVGQDDGTGHLNQSKSFASQTFNISINDDLPAQAPTMTLVGSDHTNSSSVTLNINTGASLSNCVTFSKLALTENLSSAPTSASSYTITCSTAATQSLSYTLTGEGTRTLRLWAMDSSGNVSSTASTVVVYYSTAVPNLTISSPAANSYNTGSFTLSGTCDGSVATISLSGDVSSPATLACQTNGTFAGTVTTTSGDGVKHLSLSQTNAYNNTGTASVDVTRDTSAPAVTFSSPAGDVVSSTSVIVTGTCETGASASSSLVFSGDIVGSPVTRATACLSDGTFSQSLTFTSGDGSKNLTAKQTDKAGNTGSANASAVLDQTGPTITLVATPTGAIKGGSSAIVQFQVTETHITTSQSFSIDYSLDNGSTWTSAGTVASTAGPLSSASFSSSITFPSTDTTQAKIRVTGADSLGNSSTSLNSSTFSIDSTPPTITSFVLAGGLTSVALPNIAFTMAASDTSGIGYYRMSESSTFVDSNWISYSSSGHFSLSTVNGSKTVYAWVKDSVGNISSVVSRSISLDFGNPPVLIVTSPAAGATYSVGTSVPISWTCTSSNGLDSTYPISSIQYTDDDGSTFCPITTNISDANGSYNTWTIPSTDCHGNSTTSKYFRLNISCKSAAGVVTNAYSQPINSGGWSIFAGDPWSALTNVNASIAQVTLNQTTRATVAGDINGNFYYSLGHAIMKIDATTGLVTQYAGSQSSSGCTIGTGTTLSAGALNSPILLGVDSDHTSMLVLETACSKVIRIDTVLGTATDYANDSTLASVWNFSYSKNHILIFTNGDNYSAKLWKLDLSSSGHTATWIAGTGAGCGTIASVGSDAKTSPMLCYGTNHVSVLPLANADASKIWLRVYASGNAFRFDYNSSSGSYVVGSTDVGWGTSDMVSCRGTDFDNYVYCGNWYAGRQINVFDPSTNAWQPDGVIPFAYNDDNGMLGIGLTPTQLVAIYSFNAIDLITPVIGGTWTYTTIAGQPLTTMGNGSDIRNVGFSQPVDVKYNEATGYLWVRNAAGHLRRIDTSNSNTTSTLVLATGSTDMTSSYPPMFFNKAGDHASFPGNWNSWTRLTNFSISGLSSVYLSEFMDRGSNATNSYPVPSGTNAHQDIGNVMITYMNVAYQNMVYHSNGKLYFAGRNSANDVLIFLSDTSKIYQVAGKTGVGGYIATDNGTVALGASLTNVQQMFEIKTGTYSGDLLIVDGNWLRRISVTTEAASPKIYDVFNLSLVTGYTAGTTFYDMVYDENSQVSSTLGTGTIYYIDSSRNVHKLVPNSTLTGGTDTKYTFTGTSIGGIPRLTLAPAGLLVLQPNKNRILRVSP